MRVKWHADREEFTRSGDFPGVSLLTKPPRLLLIAPALSFHSTIGIILGYLHSIDVERMGIAMEWRSRLQVVFRLRGSDGPD